MRLTIEFFIDTLYQVEEVLSVLSLLRVFIGKECWILEKDFYMSIEKSYGFSFLVC